MDKKLIEITIDEMLKKRNNMTMYRLAKECDCTYSAIHKLIKNDTVSIKFDLLAKICFALDCEISDILKLRRE